MIKQSMRLKILILPLALMLSIVAAIFYIKPLYIEMAEAKKVLGDKKSERDNLVDLNSKLQKMRDEWSALGDEKGLVLNALPEREDVDYYISELSSKSNRSGILLSSIDKSDQSSSGSSSQAYVCDASGASAGAAAAAQPAPQTSYMPAQAGAEVVGTVSTGGCVKSIPVSLAIKGSWEQMLDFFKYLEDMNRISNIKSVTIKTENANQSQDQNQETSDTLSLAVSTDIFFKTKSTSRGATLAADSTGMQTLNRKALNKLKEIVFARYDAPTVPPAGQRNIFK